MTYNTEILSSSHTADLDNGLGVAHIGFMVSAVSQGLKNLEEVFSSYYGALASSTQQFERRTKRGDMWRRTSSLTRPPEESKYRQIQNCTLLLATCQGLLTWVLGLFSSSASSSSASSGAASAGAASSRLPQSRTSSSKASGSYTRLPHL